MGAKRNVIRGRLAARARRVVAALGATLMLSVGLIAVQWSGSAAAEENTFDPTNIISDSNFYKGNAMSESQIQSFLVSKRSVLANYRSAVSSRSANISNQARPGHVYCAAFQGGSNLLASTLIYRAQVACGISAKAILVTLEKEQGLVTRSSASTGTLDIAMGYGCPDTAACNEVYYGLGNQLYMASLQFKYYQLPENGYRYQPGAEYVQYHPNASCGGTTIDIRNAATAGLYNYTPYQPNAAAIAAFPGVGNACSSYGNRNFWFIYNAWFGSPTSVDGAFAIEQAYELSGGAGGPLGAEAESLNCPASSTRCWQEFDGGFITWTNATGAVVTTGVIAERYRALGGPSGSLGYASSAAKSFDVPTNGNGEVQIFSGGYLYASDAGVFRVKNGSPIESAWIADGWIRGALGWPVGDQTCISSGACSLQFQHGMVVTAPDGSVVDGAIGDAYAALGGPGGSLGYPASVTSSFSTVNGDGAVQIFQKGYLYSSAAGVFRVDPRTPISDAWNASGWIRGPLGWPIAEKVCGLADGGCSQQFQHGTLYAPSSGSVGVVTDPKIAAAYAASDGPSGPLGYPTSVTSSFSTVSGDGAVQVFQKGYLYSSAAGVFKVEPRTPISDAWNASGWIRGSLGWPVGEMVCGLADGACLQQFQHGTLYASATASGAVTDPKIAAAYSAAGGPSGALGYPTSVTSLFSTSNGEGSVQIFQGGYLYSSAAGVFKVEPRTPISDAWNASGWIRGSLGWPAGEKVCGLPDGGCSQQFQHGTLTGAS